MQTELRHVFISYRRAEPDLGFAQRLAADLRAAGHPVWIDVEGIVGADVWAREIQSAIDECYAYILILSPDAVESNWVRRELIYAMNQKPGRIYPVLFRETPLPFELYNVQYGDFLHEDYDTAFDLLLGDLPAPLTELPRELVAALESGLGSVRRGAVATLIEIAQGDNVDQAEHAVTWLKHLCENDPDEQVCAAAERFFRPVEPSPPPAVPPPLAEPIEALPATSAEPARGFVLKPWLGIAAGLVVIAAMVGIALGIARGGRNNPAAISGALDTPTDRQHLTQLRPKLPCLPLPKKPPRLLRRRPSRPPWPRRRSAGAAGRSRLWRAARIGPARRTFTGSKLPEGRSLA